MVAGLIGTLVGGWLGDRAFAKGAGGYFSVSGWGLLLGAPIAALLPMMPTETLVFVVAFFAEVLLFLNTGPLNAALVACVPSSMRARAVAVNVFFIHALGDAISPPLMGAISDSSVVGAGDRAHRGSDRDRGHRGCCSGARRANAEPDGLLAVESPK